jgi:hypothetical protein
MARPFSRRDGAAGHRSFAAAAPRTTEASRASQTTRRDRVLDWGRLDDPEAQRQADGRTRGHHSTTEEKRVRGQSLVENLYVLLGRRCPLAPQLYRQHVVCEKEGGPFQSKIALMEQTIRTFEPVAGTLTHVLLDSWYSAKCLWRATRERDFLITTGIKSNRWLAVPDPSVPQGWRWQQLSESTAQLTASDYVPFSGQGARTWCMCM